MGFVCRAALLCCLALSAAAAVRQPPCLPFFAP
eukprot:COSAG04_NODE_14065_length_582_cov_0.697723_2_plen_32_part_01